MDAGNKFEVTYEYGTLPGFRKFQIELNDTELVLYNRNNIDKFSIKYQDIDYVWKVPFFLVWQVEDLNWQIQLFLKRNTLTDYSESEVKVIRKWFHPIPLLTPENFGYGLKMFCSRRKELLERFKDCGVTVSDRFMPKKYYYEKFKHKD